MARANQGHTFIRAYSTTSPGSHEANFLFRNLSGPNLRRNQGLNQDKTLSNLGHKDCPGVAEAARRRKRIRRASLSIQRSDFKLSLSAGRRSLGSGTGQRRNREIAASLRLGYDRGESVENRPTEGSNQVKAGREPNSRTTAYSAGHDFSTSTLNADFTAPSLFRPERTEKACVGAGIHNSTNPATLIQTNRHHITFSTDPPSPKPDSIC